MEYAKIPTDLLTDGLRDTEYAAFMKYSLLWALKEYEPDDNACLRVMSQKQYYFVKTYYDSIKQTMEKSIIFMNNKRSTDKIRYRKNKVLENISAIGTSNESITDITVDTSLESLRILPYKERNEKENIRNAIKNLKTMNLPKIPL